MNEYSDWPVVLSVAGSDSGGGAGIQADLRVFSCMRTFGVTAITALTAQNPLRVAGVEAATPAMVARQIRTILDVFSVRAVKTGMLFNADIIEVVADELADEKIPLVVDPVMVATSGARLLQEDAISIMNERLLKRADVITPNLPEAEIILRENISFADDAAAVASRLQRCFGGAVVLKGGHEPGAEAIDFLASEEGTWRFSSPRINAPTGHGTGCSFSAALAACLGRGDGLVEAVKKAKKMVNALLLSCMPVGEKAWAMVSGEVKKDQEESADEPIISCDRVHCE